MSLSFIFATDSSGSLDFSAFHGLTTTPRPRLSLKDHVKHDSFIVFWWVSEAEGLSAETGERTF